MGLGEFGYRQLQTNGSLIGEEHLRLFRRYKVRLGISIDGPGELNDARWAAFGGEDPRDDEARRAADPRLAADPALRPGLIVTLHRGNATGDGCPG